MFKKIKNLINYFNNTFETINSIITKIIEKIVKGISYIIISLLEPVVKLINTTFDLEISFSKWIKNLMLDKKKVLSIEFVLYYFLIVLIIISFSYPALFYGVLIPFNKISLFFISFGTILIISAFIIILGVYFKIRIIKYLFYGLILILVPLIFIQWIVCIENHPVFLKDLSTNQWIQIFEIFTTYFSACFIALVLGYKKENK